MYEQYFQVQRFEIHHDNYDQAISVIAMLFELYEQLVIEAVILYVKFTTDAYDYLSLYYIVDNGNSYTLSSDQNTNCIRLYGFVYMNMR